MGAHYYDIAIASRTYQGKELLTYTYHEALPAGTVVVIKLKNNIEYGFIVAKSNKPSFAVKNIDYVYKELVVPQAQVELFRWLRQYYPGGVGQTAGLFIPHSFTKKEINIHNDDVEIATKKSSLLSPTPGQQRVIDGILAEQNKTHIVHGETGSGKTLVYLHLANTIVNNKKSVIILTPEISLTPQLSEQFHKTFTSVYVVHSGLTQAERRTIWLAINNSVEPVVLIGPRSALFYPVKNIGAIIIDEFHESSYKQQQSPHYNALRVAGKLRSVSSAILVFGSATPPIEDYFYALKNGAVVHRLTEKPGSLNHPKTYKIIDLTDKSEASSHPLVSKSLLLEIRSQLQKKQQILIFLNKRGSSRLILCNNCGWKAVCERCNIPYTFHADDNHLVCHTCGKNSPVPINCPECGSADIFFKSPGTKAISEFLAKTFPDAKIGRYDKDNKKSERFSENHTDIAAGNIDILVGTQLLTKGHDLPKLGLSVVLLAENSLQFPDYKSDEMTFQILRQTAGRVGRSTIPGTVLVQTYNPSAPYIDYIKDDVNAWIHFYNTELQQRQRYKFPPFRHLLTIQVSRKTESGAEKYVSKIYDHLLTLQTPGVEILQPTMSFKYQQHSAFFWQILIKSSSRSALLEVIKMLPNGCTYNIDPISIL